MKDKSVVTTSVVTTPCDPKPLSLEERLARFDPARHGGEFMNTENPLGTEKYRERSGLGVPDKRDDYADYCVSISEFKRNPAQTLRCAHNKPISDSAMDSAEIGSLIRRERKKQKLTQEQLAALAGVGVRFVREVEHSKPSCQLELILKVMLTLGLSITVHTPDKRRP